MFEATKEERQSRQLSVRGLGASTCPCAFLIYCVTPAFHVS